MEWNPSNITVTLHGYHGISNSWLPEYLFNSLFRQQSKYQISTQLCEGNQLVDSSNKRPEMQRMFPYDILMLPHIREAGHSTPPAPHSLHSRVAHLPVARIRYYSGTRPQCRSRCHHSSAVWCHWRVAQARGRRVLKREELYHFQTLCWKWNIPGILVARVAPCIDR